MKIKFFYSPITGTSAPILSKLTLALLFHLRWVDTLLNTMFTLQDLKEGRCKRSFKNVVVYIKAASLLKLEYYRIIGLAPLITTLHVNSLEVLTNKWWTFKWNILFLTQSKIWKKGAINFQILSAIDFHIF